MGSKRLLQPVLIAAAFFFSTLSIAAAAETITSFDTDIVVHSDASVEVVERIKYDFGDAERHGIFRDIPWRFSDATGEKRLSFDEISVLDDAGDTYPFATSREGDFYRIKIGDPDVSIVGEHVYEIRYRVTGAVSFLEDRDEIYWNATGNTWEVPILRARARVAVPAPEELRSFDCYRGGYGSTERCGSMENHGDAVVFDAEGVLGAGEGLTVAVGFPKGIVEETFAATLWHLFLTFLMAIRVPLAILLPIAVAYLSYRTWKEHGDDPPERHTVIVEYNAPKGLSLLEAAYLYRGSIRPSDISAGIIALAVKGALRIEEIKEKQLLVFTKEDHKLYRLDERAPLAPDESALIDMLFDGGAKREVLMSSLSAASLQEEFSELKKKVATMLTEKGYYTRNPQSAYKLLLWPAGAMVVLSALIAVSYLILLESGVVLVGAILAVIILIVFGIFMPRLSERGVEARTSLKGLRRYVSVAEKDRLEFHNAPEKTPELFEKLLPYAMLLGVTEIWMDTFKDVMVAPPTWYTASGGAWNFDSFESGIDSLSGVVSAAAAPASSGSGGGGFSGGGGGGGGGGSW